MAKDRLSRGLLLRLALLITTVCVCVHVYLEMSWHGAPASPAVGHPTQAGPDGWGQHSRARHLSTGAKEQDRSIKRRISYVRTLKKERRRDEDRQEHSTQCCLLPHLHRKVSLIPSVTSPGS